MRHAFLRYIAITILSILFLSACAAKNNPVPPSLTQNIEVQELYDSDIPFGTKISPKNAYQKGIDYTTGTHNTTPDLFQAVDWIKFSASKGYSEAQFKLSLMYLQGIGVELDKRNAFLSMLIAAQSGKAEAQYYLSYFYRNGIGTDKNFILADYWLSQAINHGVNFDKLSSL